MRLGAYALPLVLPLLLAPAAAHAAASPVCSPVQPPFMHCDSYVVRRAHTHARAAGTVPSGYGPADLQDAYGLTNLGGSAGSDQTVAIVDAYDNPNAESDLATYRSQYGLPACTTGNGCFRKVDQAGGTSYPAPDAGWASEISLDLQMVSAVCPHCKILLVEAASSYFDDLGTAVNTAADLGATQISNSYGNVEGSSENIYDLAYFNHPGVAVTVSSGDDGYTVEWPAASPYVTAVGGTSLLRSSTPRGWTETAWTGAGSGCSAYEAKPSWQTDSGCPGRTVADVSAVADPATGVAVYDSYGFGGWVRAGGTSAAAPLVAGAYALLGSVTASPSFAYANPTWFNDVSSGSNGACSPFAYFCTAVAGFDGPTGMGTPNFNPGGTPVDGGAAAGGSGSGSTPPTSPPPANPQPAPVIRSSVSVSSRAVTATRTARLRVRLSCGHGPACNGVLSLQALAKRGLLRPVGKQRFSIKPGGAITLTVRLSKSGMRLLKQKRRLRVYGTALDSDGSTAQSSFVLHAPKRAPRRR